MDTLPIRLTATERLIARLLAAGDRESLAAGEFARVVLDETEGNEAALYSACTNLIERLRAVRGAIRSEEFEAARAGVCTCAGFISRHALTCPRYSDDRLPFVGGES